MKIVLIGFMGAGKTSVAKILGSHLKLPILEMDELVFKKTGLKDMHEVFAKGGEILLRETEIAIAKEYASNERCIISTGAGVVMNKIVLDYLKQHNGKIIFLNASFETINNRLKGDSVRPLFKNGEEAKALFHFRQPLYMKYADETIEVDNKSLQDIAHEIMRYFK